MGSTSKRARVTYNPNFGKPHKAGKASTELLKQFKTLTNRIAKEGETKWLKNAMAILAKRLAKSGLTKKAAGGTTASYTSTKAPAKKAAVSRTRAATKKEE